MMRHGEDGTASLPISPPRHAVELEEQLLHPRRSAQCPILGNGEARRDVPDREVRIHTERRCEVPPVFVAHATE